MLNPHERTDEELEARSETFDAIERIDYSKKENQIGCGYCAHEESCDERDSEVNKAKQGCLNFIHYLDLKPNNKKSYGRD